MNRKLQLSPINHTIGHKPPLNFVDDREVMDAQPYRKHVQIRQSALIDYIADCIDLSSALVISHPSAIPLLNTEPKWLFLSTSTADQKLQETRAFDLISHHRHLAIKPHSQSTLIIPIGVPIDNLTALLYECHTILQDQGILLLFVAHKTVVNHQSKPKIFGKKSSPIVPYIKKKLPQIGYSFIEQFSLCLLPKTLLSSFPILIGKVDGWCYKFPAMIGQYRLIIAKKTTLSPTLQYRHLHEGHAFSPPQVSASIFQNRRDSQRKSQ